jgi:plasmid stability protein
MRMQAVVAKEREMPEKLSIEDAPDHVVDRLRERAKLHRRSLQGELLAIVETAVLDDGEPIAPALDRMQRDISRLDRQVSEEASQLEELLEQVRSLPDERQQEVAQVLLAWFDEQDYDLGLSPEQIAEIERRAADDGPYATDEEVQDVFARLTR